ncbi:C6 finger domain-containing protein [Pochonia chlamydosporia 170]|uniref:C6 finger domain-containing protein n=1 Tax=Pochonia chlamydosporia 170 TaxID=1380566 RepID=A0A179EYP1_METCM|nr:C6 finger domain-containing protein [Pochonia chlamydosporia 170]OAQ58317.1 C6 finger domain-containing protein [Pochonia chlamydosporia 170]
MRPRRRLKLRSRTGCSRCRARHQKCDEHRPSCTRCVEAGCDCVYSEGFAGLKLRAAHLASKRPTISAGVHGTTNDLPPFLDPSHYTLLIYLVEEATSAISCHESIRYDTSSALLCAGSNYPCFLYSGLVFAALHKVSFLRCPEAIQRVTMQILELRAKALSMLQIELQSQNKSDEEVVMATALMLATCELRYSPRHHTWRNHFEVTRRLIEQRQSSRKSQHGDTTLSRFIDRRFNTIQFLVSLPATWAPRTSPMTFGDCCELIPSLQTVGEIDGTMAFCRELLDVFRLVGKIEDIKYWSRNAGDPPALMVLEYWKDIAWQLVSIVLQMMERDIAQPPLLAADLGGTPSAQDVEEYRALNTIAQHVALICLYHHNIGLEHCHPNVTNSVSSIVQIAAALTQRVGLHPSICLTTALFTAGCVAGEEHQGAIAELLDVQYRVTKSQNTQVGLKLLKKLWVSAGGETSAGMAWDNEAEEMLQDFIPY